MLLCYSCIKIKDITEFSKCVNKDKTKGLCKECANKRSLAYHYANKEQLNERGRKYYAANKDDAFSRTLKKYKLTREQYDEILKSQNYCCKICQCVPEERVMANGRVIPEGRLCVDHDHTTGEPRGLLCHSCNIVIGHVERKPFIIDKLQSYLDEYKQ